MKHFFLSFLLLALSTLGMAQINLREGIVITLAGDTLHGDIDYRTDAINAEQCLFRQDGGGELVTYKLARFKAIDSWRMVVFMSPKPLLRVRRILKRFSWNTSSEVNSISIITNRNM